MKEWQRVQLGSVASIEKRTVQPDEIDPEIKYIGLENIEPGGALVNVTSAGNAQPTSPKTTFSKECVLFGKLRPYLVKIARPEFSGICSTDIIPITPGENLDRGYLAHFLAQPSTVSLATSRATGANLPRLSPKELLKFEIPLPSINEQRRIAAVLDKVDALRAKRREAIALLDDLTQSVFLDMFGNPSDSWPEVTVEDVAAPAKGSIRTGPFGSQLRHDEFVNDGIAVLGIDNAISNEFRWGERRYITEEKYKKLSRYTVHPGDVLITIMGTCGRCAVVPDNIPLAINTKHLCCITLDREKCLPDFLHSYFLRHPNAQSYLRKAAKGAIMSGLNMSIIKAMPVKLPPVKLQQEFVDRISAITSLKEAHRAHLAHLDELFASLQQRAFRGELFSSEAA